VKILFVNGYGIRVGVRGASIDVRNGEEERQIPLSEIDMVVISTSGVSISSNAVRMLSRVGIDVVFLGPRGDPVALIYSSNPTRTVDTKRSQYMAYNTQLAVKIAGEIVRSKALNQAWNLERLFIRTKKGVLKEAQEAICSMLREVDEVVEKGDVIRYREELMNVEARIAREYWGAVARAVPRDVGFDGRDRDSPDPLNTSLNYGYGVLYSLVWKAAVLAGLDPYAGFLHVDRSGKPVLVFDLVECWRAPLVDWPIISLFLSGWRPKIVNGRLDLKSRETIIRSLKEALGRSCKSSYRPMRCEEAIRSYALRFASSLRRGAVPECYKVMSCA
jgi:CRISPR-associated protein Cas1